MITEAKDDSVYRYGISIELSHELNPLSMFANSEIPPDVDNMRRYDLLTAHVWRGTGGSILQIDEPEIKSVLFYADNSKQSDVDDVVRLAGQMKNVLALVLIRKPTTTGISTLPVFVVKWMDVQAYIRHPSGARVSIRAVSLPAILAMKAMKDSREAEAPPLPPAPPPLPPPPPGEQDDLKRRSNGTIDGSQVSSACAPPRDIAADERERDIFADPYYGQQSCTSSTVMDPPPPAYDQGGFTGVEVPLGSHPLDQGESSAAAMALNNDDSVYNAGIAPDGNSKWGGNDTVAYLFGEESAQGDDCRKSIDDEEFNTNHKEKNIFARGFFDVLTLPFRGPDSWDKVLSDVDGWKQRGHSKRYIEAMDRLDRALNGEGREKALEIARKVHQYLQSPETKATVLQLTFAAKVFYRSGVYELAPTVLFHLHVKFENVNSTKFDDAIRRSSGNFDKADRKPNNIFHAFFMRVFKSWNYLGPFRVGLDTILVCIFNCWAKCGMFQRKNIDWNELRLVVSSVEGFSPCENKSLQRSLGIDRANTLGLFLCDNVEQAVHVLTLTRKTTHVRFVSVEPIFATWLISHIRDTIANLEGDLDAVGRVWRDVLVALDFTSFRQSYSENVRRDVLSCLVGSSSFRERKSFKYYLPVLEGVHSNYIFYGSLLDLVRESIISDLRTKEQPPPMHEFLSMLESGAGDVLLSAWNGEISILDFVKSTIIRQASVEEQVDFTGRFLDILFTKTSILKRPDRLAPSLITFLREQSPSKQALWIAAFQVAKSTPLLFKRCGDEQVGSIVELILPTGHGAVLLEQPQLVVELLHLEEDHVPGPFYVSLQARVEVILRKAALTIKKACMFYLQSHNEASTASMAVAASIFLEAFSAWNPSSIETIMDKDESTLALLFRCFDGCPPPSVAECAVEVSRVVNDWHRAFQDNAVTWTILQDSLQACQKAGWQPLCEWAGIQLPNKSTVAEKLDELESVAAEVFQLLSVRDAESISMSLSSILKGYNCQPTPSSELDRLLSRYEPFLLSQCPTDAATFLDKNRLELRQIHSDRDAASNFSQEYGDAIHTCNYFLKNPSALFRKGMSTFTKNKLEIEALHIAVERTLKTIGDLFGPRTTFKDVDDAVKLISSSGGSLEQELEFLTGCPALQLTTEDEERFKAVALMSRFSGPLDRFIKFCWQFKFAVVQADPSFKQLEQVSVSLVSEQVLGLDAAECMDFAARLAGLLCPGIVGQSSVVELRAQMENTLPCIKTLGLLSTHSEIWTFARDMNWFGREGLKTFYAEYNNCTNLLLGNTASYEMSVLYALQPTIRAVSLIGSLQGETSLGAFLDALQASSDVKKCSHGGASSDLNQVQSNLSQIREWFTNGVDDIAAVYGLFEAVSRTGEFSIQVKQDEQPILTLAYQDRDGRKLLQGKDLVGFVQHVGLIQHEDDRIAGEVTCFVELYMMLAKAANNVVEMLNLGFDADIGSFTCCAGSGQLDQARELLHSSDVATRNHEMQLLALREHYRVSTLFFTEELKEIYDIFTYGGPDSELWPELVRKISRLLCPSTPSMPRVSWEERCQVCGTVALSMKHVRNQNDVGWLRIGSKLIENLHGEFGDRAIQCDAKIGRTGRIVLHTLAVEDDQMNWAIFCLLRSIYKDRLPESFEVMDAMEGCTLDHLELFLRRAQMFTSYAFVLLNVDRLTGNLPEKLISFLSRREVASCGIHLHCIQSKPSLLHTGPWVDGATWDLPSLQIELNKYDVRDDSWKRLILDPLFVDNVSIVWTPSSGTGKTCYIRKQLSELQEVGSEVATITIHEESSIASLVGDLSTKFSSTEEERAVHFNFCCLPERSDATSSWLESVNQFFFSLLILRTVYDPMSGRSFHLGERSWKVFIELPAESTAAVDWLRVNIPTLAFCGNMLIPPNEVVIDKETRRVCTYLRAFRDGTINRKFIASRGRRIIFILDRSSSMAWCMGDSNALSVATDNALRLFDSHVNVGDVFGLTMFNDTTSLVIPSQVVMDDMNKAHLRRTLDSVRHMAQGGTQMYNALLETVSSAEDQMDVDTYMICLTDGESSTNSQTQLEERLRQSSDKLRIMLIGINLRPVYENKMRNLCGKYCGSSSGCFVPSNGTLSELNAAFAAVASRIPVSQTFELFDGVLSDDECRPLLRDYAPPFLSAEDMLMQTFWVRFLYRRVKVFDLNTDFNENVQYDSLGSTLMETMLEEVKRLLAENQRRDWIGENHAQLVYDFSDANDPKFRLVCTSPDELSGDLRKRYEALDLPGFCIPTKDELSERGTLDRFLSQALGVPLHPNEDGAQRLKCIDQHGFILTLDFTMKLLNIHERVACRVPCLIEGETGVSKTALTKMYSILRNSSLQYEAKDLTELDISSIEQDLQKKGFSLGSGETPLLRLHETLVSAAQKSIGDETEVAEALQELLRAKQGCRPAIYQAIPSGFNLTSDSRTSNVRDFLDWFAAALLEPTFFEVNVDASLTQEDVVSKFREIRTVARKLLSTDALVVVFLDEINTSSIMGVFKEIVVDRTLMGEMLEENIVVVAACNPFRIQATTKGECLRENDLGREWASGHYQVVELPMSLKSVRWNFGSLSHSCEKDFIFRRMERICGKTMPLSVKAAMTEVVAASHGAMRHFASENILAGLVRVRGDKGGMSTTMETSLMDEAAARASSVVSLRDIQRVFALYIFFSADFLLENGTPRDAMTLAVAIVYYLRLDDESRDEFKQLLQSLPTERGAKSLQTVLDEAMDAVIAKTEIPQGIALTRGLRENVFMTLTCLLSRTPLLIVGPPGTSKTLAVNITSDNSNGEDSPSEFYRNHARLSVYHYQCSKQSTSKEIAAVFEKATQQQEKLDPKKHRCFVFMDEAGLPEEEKESLKVLHYLLEGHMSTTSEVGFVGISNHVLDAAKSNRCVMLLRQEPDTYEMLSIAKGVLFDSRETATCVVEHVDLDGVHHDGIEFASSLCKSYGTLVQQHSWFETFFGLRDFIYFLKALRVLASFQLPKMTISIKSIVSAIERNFNGVAPDLLRQIALSFLEPVARRPRQLLINELIQSLNDPLEVIRQSLRSLNSNQDSSSSRSRYKLIIDKTDDDSIVRLLDSVGIVDLTKKSLFKLSQLPEEVHVERMKLVAGVKFAALQGKLAVLSQTEPVNEAMYDLFNQRFHVVGDRLFANIAIEGVSRRCLVRPSFECVVHVRESQLHLMPAPFLNRFEKYTLGTDDVLKAGWSRLGKLATVFGRARDRVSHLLAMVPGSGKGMFGWVDGQTLDSLFIDLLPTGALESAESSTPLPDNATTPDCFAGCLAEFISLATSLRIGASDVEVEIDLAKSFLRQELLDVLLQISSERQIDATLVRESLHSLFQVDVELGTMAELCSVLIQMVVTRLVVTRVIQIASPEVVYLGSTKLPSELVSSYFSKEHFNLRRVIEQSTCTSATKKVILYARSDAAIRSIPSYSMTQRYVPLDTEGVGKIKELVHGNAEEVVIEHLTTLRSETMLRASVEAWIKDDERTIFLLIVDMGTADSVDHVNFARTLVEQRLPEDKGKVFVMLLHHPPSVTNRASCYPALFLQGWNHVFLDGIGISGPSLGVETCIEFACKAQLGETDHLGHSASVKDLSSSLQLMLPRVVGHAATHMIFSAEQLGSASTGPGEQVSYRERYRFLMMHMSKSVDGETIGAILCSKFAALWLKTCLLKTMRRASEGLICGRTQLSLSMSIRSNLLDTFAAYLLAMVKEMNQGQSLSILSGDSMSEDVERLFVRILGDLPVAPFDELLLLRKTGVKTGATQVSCQFPFFPFISQCLDDLLELAYQEMASSVDTFSLINEKKSDVCMMFHKCVMELLGEIANDTESTIIQQRRAVVRDVACFVQQQTPHDDSLFERYLHDFISCKTNCLSNGIALQWNRNKLDSLGFDLNLVGVHVVAKILEKEFMSVASWSTTGAAQALKRIAGLSTPGNDVLAQFMEYFERCLGCNETNRGEWSRSFARFLRQTAVLASNETIKKGQASRLRVLCFFHILLCCDAPASVQSEALQLWYDRDQHKLRANFNDCDVALSTFVGLLGVCDKTSFKAIELSFKHFFSPLWINVTTLFRQQDFQFLLDYIPKAQKLDSQLIPLLRGACLAYGSTSDASTMLGMPAIPLHLINCQLRSIYSPQFSSNDTRVSLPHFVPKWLLTLQPCGDGDSEFASGDPELGVAFTEYNHCFDGQLSETVFGMLLQAVIQEAETLTSEALLLTLLQDIEAEVSLHRDEYTRLARIRSGALDKSLDVTPCRGSLVSAMILDARLICFLAKTAFELATQKKASCLSGTYSSLCRRILELTISVAGCRWGDFFFHTILQARGEGTLASLLGIGGVLHTLSWCKPWIEGASTVKAESQHALERAESELADALQEEHRKTRELRLCPHCGNTFIVAARECGTFKCGSDAHGGIGGVQVRATYGCGQQFNVDDAPHYAVDERILDPLRARIEGLRNCMQRCDASAWLWERARAMDVPILSFCIDEKSNEEMFIPAASMAAQMKNEAGAQSLLLLQRLRASSDLVFQQSVLPDLIELYVWLHGTFRYLVTKTEAMDLRMKDIMVPEKLCSRFDFDQANHVMGMWNRASKGLKDILKQPDRKIFYQCEEIEFPFDNFDDAPLLALLSEGDHPTDGNDFLFLIINTIIDRYNSFVRWMGEYESESRGSHNEYSLHPKFVMRGSYGAVVMGELAVLSETELNLLIERTWDSESQKFDMTRLNDSLKHELLLHVQRPLLLNPMGYLRERFSFRNETHTNTASQERSDGITTGCDGNYFANAQDGQLYNDVCELLGDFLSEGCADIRRTLEDTFHTVDYNELRSVLEGARSILQLLDAEGRMQMDDLGETLCTAYNVSRDQLASERLFVFTELGFPNFNNAQFELLVSLKPGEFVEMVRFVGFQLASEAYQFSGLPLCMKEPLGDVTIRQLNIRLEELKSMEGLESTLAILDEFVRDVLSFYETQIYGEASSRSDSLRSFLLQNNYCDDTDRIFARLPADVSLRNYTSLRCHFHQLKLSWLVQSGDGSSSCEMAVDATMPIKPQPGQCWLWDEREPSDTNDVKDRALWSDKPATNLWFSVDPRNATKSQDVQVGGAGDELKENASIEIDNMSIDGEITTTEVILIDDLAARTIQRCWRRRIVAQDRVVDMEEYFVMDDDTADFEDDWDFPAAEPFVEQQEEIQGDALALASMDIDGVVPMECELNVPPTVTPTSSKDEEDTHLDTSRYSRSRNSESPYVAPMDTEVTENKQPLTELDVTVPPKISKQVFSYESLYEPDEKSTKGSTTLYGTEEDEIHLRRWLDEHKLPQSVGDELIRIGARDVKDVVLIFEQCEDELKHLKRLDQIKLKKAIIEAVKNTSST